MKIDERRKLLCSSRREQRSSREWEMSGVLWPNAEYQRRIKYWFKKLDDRNRAQSRAPSADGSVSNEMWQTRWYLSALSLQYFIECIDVVIVVYTLHGSKQCVFDLRHLETMSAIHASIRSMYVFDAPFLSYSFDIHSMRNDIDLVGIQNLHNYAN